MKYIAVVIIPLIILSCNFHRDDKKSDQGLCTELSIPAKKKGTMSIEAVALHEKFWPHQIDQPIIITVKFLNGSDFQRRTVMKYAPEWEKESAKNSSGEYKIHFNFISPDDTNQRSEIRIRFKPGGSSSYVGTDALEINEDSATMFFGWIYEGRPDSEIRQVVLHEFGHLLGLVHEHQSPLSNIPWDSAEVYKYYATTQNPTWDSAKVNSDIFQKYKRSQTNYTNYDPGSIMHYAISGSLTKGGYSTPWNSQLSPTDKMFIKKLYQFAPCQADKLCCFNNKGQAVICR